MRRVLALMLFVSCSGVVRAQSTNASLSGRVTDPTGGVVLGAQVDAVNTGTNFRYASATNGAGQYYLSNLPPGSYQMEVELSGFKKLVKPDVVLHVQDTLTIDFELEVGPVSESITVRGGAPLVNASDATVSTLVDNRFVGDMPLNGRSFLSLITLTPGVVLTAATENNPGQFSVNGQRPDANYFTVDGVGANLGIIPDTVLNQVGGGAVPATTASGGFNNLVSIDALQEFRVVTSTYAPEFGRTPGGQIQIVTRSGTNAFHGTLFDYFRNTVLDANNWFADQNGLAKPAERQNDFGGVLGGLVLKDRTFFFFSYEGLRLDQPMAATTEVPSVAVREAAVTAIQPYLNAFPIPDGAPLSGGFAGFSASYTLPTNLDATSIRMDQTLGGRFRLFGRYNRAPSQAVSRAPFGGSLNQVSTDDFLTETVTAGGAYALSPSMVNEFRVNWSRSTATAEQTLDNLGGAVPILDDSWFPPAYAGVNHVNFIFAVLPTYVQRGKGTLDGNEQRQINIVDNHSLAVGPHQLKFGVDWRHLMPVYSVLAYNGTAIFPNALAAETGLVGSGDQIITVAGARYPIFDNLSLYAQDSFRIKPRLTATYGLRWELDPAPHEAHGNDPVAVTGLNNPSTLALAPKGTPQWSTTYGNFAPRVGLAYSLSEKPGTETVLRGGFGIFYDLGDGYNLNAFSDSWPIAARNFIAAGTPFPYSSAVQALPITMTLPAGALYVSVPNLKLPRTYEWNVAVERSMGRDQSLKVTCVGALGRDLLWMDYLSNPNPISPP